MSDEWIEQVSRWDIIELGGHDSSDDLDSLHDGITAFTDVNSLEQSSSYALGGVDSSFRWGQVLDEFLNLFYFIRMKYEVRGETRLQFIICGRGAVLPFYA